MKNFYFIIDNALTAKAEIFSEKLETEDRTSALKEAETAWDRLTAREQERRDAFCLAYGPVDEDGEPDMDCPEFEIIKEFR